MLDRKSQLAHPSWYRRQTAPQALASFDTERSTPSTHITWLSTTARSISFQLSSGIHHSHSRSQPKQIQLLRSHPPWTAVGGWDITRLLLFYDVIWISAGSNPFFLIDLFANALLPYSPTAERKSVSETVRKSLTRLNLSSHNIAFPPARTTWFVQAYRNILYSTLISLKGSKIPTQSLLVSQWRFGTFLPSVKSTVSVV